MGKLNAMFHENGHSNKEILQLNVDTMVAVAVSSMKNCITETVIDLDKEKLLYRAEGNANLVLSLPDCKKVLRLRKTNVEQHIDVNDQKSDSPNIILSVEYINLISRLFGHPYTYQPTIINLKVNSYESFNNRLLPVRPAHRLNKEVNCSTGILYPDVTFLPDALYLDDGCSPLNRQINTGDTFSVEIKPKQGWTFNLNDFSNCLGLFNLENITKCRYCCMQYLKLSQGSIQKVTDYCPIDLFSGNPMRMKKAIVGLISSPQNNFCILKNGKLIYGNKSELHEIDDILSDIFGTKHSQKKQYADFINVIIKLLLNEFRSGLLNKEQQQNNRLSIKAKNQRFICEELIPSNLPEQCILKQILNIQLLSKSSLCAINKLKEANNPYTYINNLISKSKSSAINSPLELLQYLDAEEKYLLGATALDCSIMLTFHVLTEEELLRIDDLNKNHVITVSEHKVLANVTVMDLDPKPIHHFAKYIRQTNLSHEAFIQYFK